MRKLKLRSQIITLIIMVMLVATILSGCGKDTSNNNDRNTHGNIDNEAIDSETKVTDEIDEIENADETDNIAEYSDTDKGSDDKIEIKIAALKGPTGMGMVKMMEDAENGTAANDYKFTVVGEADVVSTGLIKGDFDIAAVPCNLASVLYNKTEGQIKIAAINTLGVLYIVETGNEITTVEDLRGKTIYSTGYGTTPQYTLNYLLSINGIDPEKDVNIEYKTESTEVAALLENSTDAIAMLPQPYVTTVMMNNDKVRIALDIEKEWTEQNQDGSGVVTGVVVVNKEFLEKNPEAVESFMAEYNESAKFVNDNIDQAAQLIEKFEIFKAAVAKKAMPYCNITFIRGQEMKTKVEAYLNVLYNQNPKAIGGTMPAEDFYYVQ
ncbi:MAG: ABC transporter substrate-binding protein [Clostridiales bacterium]|nr:ABC transporter substrate-binding protein [Clostridiales bacterium]